MYLGALDDISCKATSRLRALDEATRCRNDDTLLRDTAEVTLGSANLQEAGSLEPLSLRLFL